MTNQDQSPIKSPIYLPIMGCGTWAWGNRFLWGYNPTMDDELQQVFNLCVQNNVTLFDTGDSYGTGQLKGRSEILLGKFSENYTGVNQAKICLATKLAAYPWRLTRQSMVSAGLSSATRLGRNIDLVQMHWSTANYAPWQEKPLLDGLADLYDKGFVKGVGLSNYGPSRLRTVHKQLSDRQVPIITLQVQYSLLSTFPVTELGLKDVCDQLGIKLIAYSPLALGLLTGKYGNGKYPAGVRGLLFRKLLPGLESLLQCLQEIATIHDKTMSQVALNWCICKGVIPIPGAKNISQAQDNIGALNWQLDPNEVEALDQQANNSDSKMVQNIFQTR